METPKVALAIIVIIFFLFGLPDVEAPRGKGDLSMVAKQQAIELLNDTEYGGVTDHIRCTSRVYERSRDSFRVE